MVYTLDAGDYREININYVKVDDTENLSVISTDDKNTATLKETKNIAPVEQATLGNDRKRIYSIKNQEILPKKKSVAKTSRVDIKILYTDIIPKVILTSTSVEKIKITDSDNSITYFPSEEDISNVALKLKGSNVNPLYLYASLILETAKLTDLNIENSSQNIHVQSKEEISISKTGNKATSEPQIISCASKAIVKNTLSEDDAEESKKAETQTIFFAGTKESKCSGNTVFYSYRMPGQYICEDKKSSSILNGLSLDINNKLSHANAKNVSFMSQLLNITLAIKAIRDINDTQTQQVTPASASMIQTMRCAPSEKLANDLIRKHDTKYNSDINFTNLREEFKNFTPTIATEKIRTDHTSTKSSSVTYNTPRPSAQVFREVADNFALLTSRLSSK